MEIFFKTIVFALLLVNSGCDSSKTVTAGQEKQEMKQTTVSDYSSDGFTKVIMTRSSSSGCPYVFSIVDSDEKLDPLNLEEGKFSSYKKEGETLWIKYRRLRRANRCPEANPVEIVEIKQ